MFSNIQEITYLYKNYFIQLLKLTRAHIGIAVLPSFWLGSIFAIILGNEFDLIIFLCGFFIIFLIYASASYINDFYDFSADKYNQQFGFSGGSGVLQKYPELKNITQYLALGMIILSLFLTTILIFTTYLPFWSVGYIGIGAFFSWFYSAPPIKFSYKGMSEIPHFIAGIMNAGWGYILVTGTIDFNLFIFAIPLSLHLLNVILIFELPDREADIHGKKKNIIVTYGRKNGYLLITSIFWIAAAYYLILAITGWYDQYINFWFISIASILPVILSMYMYFESPFKKDVATKFAIKTAISLFSFSILFLLYFIYLAL